jgi:ectoine hydroxylase-related dioxygenase (phytanoyl-CoA dioxygenase family)
MRNILKNILIIRILRRIKYLYYKFYPLKEKNLINLDQNIKSIENFFRIFGIIKLRNIYNKNDLKILIKEYDKLVYLSTKVNLKKNDDTPKAIRNNLNFQIKLARILETSKILKILECLIGHDMILTGVELVTFRNGTRLHRDTFQPFSTTKIGLYLQESNWLNNGEFIYVPGSHNWYSNFAKDDLSNLIGWPDNHWGLDENLLSNNLTITNKESFELSLEEPISKIHLDLGDVLIFDNRLIHGTYQKTFRTRRMIAFSFIEGYTTFKTKKPNISECKFIKERALFIAAEYIATRKSQNQEYNTVEHTIDANFNFLKKYLLNNHEKNLIKSYINELNNDTEKVKKIITGNYSTLN